MLGYLLINWRVKMISKIINCEFGHYKQSVNHGHKVHTFNDSIDAYKEPSNGGYWSTCPCCNEKPLTWCFDNGRSTSCGCWSSTYDHFSVNAESIMSVHTRCDGTLSEYDGDGLRKNWNEYCATMINPCSHGDLIFLDRW